MVNTLDPKVVQVAERVYGLDVADRITFGRHLLDASNRLRVGQPETLFISKQIYGLDVLFESLTNGAGASIEYLPNEASALLTVGAVNGESAVRQSIRYYTYLPGKSQNIIATGVIGPGSLSVVRRTKTSGAVVDNVVTQSNWNLDRLDGSKLPHNPTGVTLDPSKMQVFVIDFQWLGADKIRYGVFLGGDTVYFHEVISANTLETVYMSTPDLPLRYEIKVEDGVVYKQIGYYDDENGIFFRSQRSASEAATHSMRQTCSTVASEAGYRSPGLGHSVGSGINLRDVSNTRTPVLAIRQKTTFRSKTNRRIARLFSQRMISQSNAVYAELAHLTEPSGITATWDDVHATDSSIEYSTDISAVTSLFEHVIDSGYVPEGQAGKGDVGEADVNELQVFNNITQNVAADNSEMFVIYATALTGVSASVGATMSWLEYD